MNSSFSKNEYENPIPYLAGTGKGSLALLVCFVPYSTVSSSPFIGLG